VAIQTTLARIREARLAKVDKLREMGINPYPSVGKKDCDIAEILNRFGEFDGKELVLAGRLMSWREHGALVFGDLMDRSGRLQIIIKKDGLASGDSQKQILGFDELTLLDVGDFVEVAGIITKSSSGEISIEAKEIKLLTKSIRSLPEKYKGLRDSELIFRRRYLDLVMNPERREMFVRKSNFWAKSRQFMGEHGFMEVETPVLEHVTGGADAKPFVTHHNALDEDFYLRISTELYQKRLIGGGFEKIYTLGPNFRNEGIDDEHLQEYTQLEWYWAYANYRDNMGLVRDIFRHLAHEVYGKAEFEAHGHKFNLDADWYEIDYVSEISDKLGVNVLSDPEDKMLDVIKSHGVELGGGAVNRARLADNLWKIIRKDVAGPAFLVNTPKFVSPLAKSMADKPELTERFQVIIAGSELGNGYSELNDPMEQLERFEDQQKAREAGDEEAQMMDEDYVEMLEYGMPPTSGFGMSERVFWFLEGVAAREGVFFPQMRRKKNK